MGSQEIFGGVFPVLGKVLDLRSIKHKLVASNVANADTPNYEAFDLVVEEELAKLMKAGKKVELQNTHRDHLSITEIGLDSVKGRPAATTKAPLKGDSNSVDIDRMMSSLAENTLLYNTMAQILSKKFSGLKAAIQEGRR